jgi:hypothetical protein
MLLPPPLLLLIKCLPELLLEEPRLVVVPAVLAMRLRNMSANAGTALIHCLMCKSNTDAKPRLFSETLTGLDARNITLSASSDAAVAAIEALPVPVPAPDAVVVEVEGDVVDVVAVVLDVGSKDVGAVEDEAEPIIQPIELAKGDAPAVVVVVVLVVFVVVVVEDVEVALGGAKLKGEEEAVVDDHKLLLPLLLLLVLLLDDS